MFRPNKRESTSAALNTLCDFATSKWRQRNRVILVEDGDDSEYVECCYKLFHLLNNIKACDHAVMDILTDTLELFHHEYGCSTRTLLLMCRVWYNTICSLNNLGLTTPEITESLQQILTETHSLIDNLSQPIKALFKTSVPASCYSRHSAAENNHLPSLLKLAEGVCRGDELVNDCLYAALTRFDDIKSIECGQIHVMGVSGPTREKSTVVEGLVASLEESQTHLLQRRDRFKCVLMIGDLKSAYKHTGYKPLLKHQNVTSHTDILSQLDENDWNQTVLGMIKQIGLNAVFIKGICDSTLKSNLIQNGIVVFDHTPSSILQTLSRQTNTILHHNIDDVQVEITPRQEQTTLNVNNSVELKLKILNVKIKRNEILVAVETTTASSCTDITVLVCSSSPVEVNLLEERLHHALSRLDRLFKTQYYIRENFEEKLYQHFTRLAESESKPARSAAYQQFSIELMKYTQTACDATLEQYDCSVIKKEAIRLGLKAALYCSKLDVTVKTGVEQHESSQYENLI